MSTSLFISFGPNVSMIAYEANLIVENAKARLTFTNPSFGLRAVLEQLANSDGEFEDLLIDIMKRTDGDDALAKFWYYMPQLCRRGLIHCSARLGETILATLEACSVYFQYKSNEWMADQSYILSRFAYLRRWNNGMVLESPLAHARVVLHDWRSIAMIHAISHSGQLTDLMARLPESAGQVVPFMLKLLVQSGMVQATNQEGISAEDVKTTLQSWEFHDLLFHARSRMGRHDNPVGATWRFARNFDQPSALKPPMSNETIGLFRPDMEQIELDEPSFVRVQELRQSIRKYGNVQLDAKQLGEFLFRVARVKQLSNIDHTLESGEIIPMDFASRPYPNGGALYELELYPVLNACHGLARGMYHYDPLNHRLERLAEMTTDVNRLLEDAAWGSQIQQEKLQVLIIISSRFQRIAWKYASMAYSASLKHVGVLYQTMYLTATAMGLAPCALGDGDSDCFARAAGLDYCEETSVGEFLLGNKPE